MKTSMSFIHDDPICEVVGLSLMSLCFFISDNRRLFFDVVKYALARPQGVLICLKSRQHHGLKMHGKKKEWQSCDGLKRTFLSFICVTSHGIKSISYWTICVKDARQYVYVYKIYLNRYLLCENSMLFWMERRMYDKAAKIPMNCMWLLGVLAESWVDS